MLSTDQTHLNSRISAMLQGGNVMFEEACFDAGYVKMNPACMANLERRSNDYDTEVKRQITRPHGDGRSQRQRLLTPCDLVIMYGIPGQLRFARKRGFFCWKRGWR